MVQDAGADYQVEGAIEGGHPLDWQLRGDEIRQVVLPCERVRVLETRRADVDRRHARLWPADRVLCRLERAAPGDQDVQIFPVFARGPEQVKLGAASIRALPVLTLTLEIGDGRRIGMAGVERPYGIVRGVSDSGLAIVVDHG